MSDRKTIRVYEDDWLATNNRCEEVQAENARLRAALNEVRSGNSASCIYCRENDDIARRALEEKGK